MRKNIYSIAMYVAFAVIAFISLLGLRRKAIQQGIEFSKSEFTETSIMQQEATTQEESAQEYIVAELEPETTEITKAARTYQCEWADISLNEADYKLLCTTVYCESGNQSEKTQQMVALVILNRIASGIFPCTVREVVYQENQFAVTNLKDFEKRGWSDMTESAVNKSLKKNDYPADMFYFRSEHYHSFGKKYIQSEDLFFSTEGQAQ